MATFNKWQKFEINYLIENYSLYTEEDIEYLAGAMNKTKKAVAEKLQELYCRKVVNKEYELKIKSKRWTYEDTEFLKENLGKLEMEFIERYLNRTYSSIRGKIFKLNLRVSDINDKFTLLKFGKLIGKSYSSMNEWASNQDFPIIMKKIQHKKVKHVNIDKFWEWAENHKELVSFSNIKKDTIPDEPEWVEEQRQIENNFRALKSCSRWTNEEVNELKKLLKENKYTYKELSKMLDRSEQAIKRKIIKGNFIERPVGDYKICLTEEQVNKIIEYYNLNYSIVRIAKLLNIREATIGNKIQKLIKKGILKHR